MIDQPQPGAQEAVLSPYDRAVLDVHRAAMKRLLQEGRYVLKADELVESADQQPRFEVGDDKLGVYFFSVDCTLRGERRQGCLFAGELMMVPAPNLDTARKIASDGLKSTIDAIFEEAYTRSHREAAADGLIVDAHGRKIKSDKPADPEFARTLTGLLSSKVKH